MENAPDPDEVGPGNGGDFYPAAEIMRNGPDWRYPNELASPPTERDPDAPPGRNRDDESHRRPGGNEQRGYFDN